MDVHGAVTGRAVSRDAFVVSLRGRVLVPRCLTEGLMRQGGVVSTSQGTMSYSGPEIVDHTDGTASLAVIVPDTAAAQRLQPGDALTFHDPPAPARVAGHPET